MKPETLDLCIGGYMGRSYRVEWKRGTLLYTCWANGWEREEKFRIKPTAEAWTKFWTRLDELGFWSWGGSYQPRGRILDGTDWSALVTVGDRSVDAHGSNAYPPSSPRARRARESGESGTRFYEFCEAVSELLGGRDFG